MVSGRLSRFTFGSRRHEIHRRTGSAFTFRVISTELGKPVLLPDWAGRPQGMLLAVRVREDGKSERCAVMAQIAVWNMAASERVAHFRLVFHRKMI